MVSLPPMFRIYIGDPGLTGVTVNRDWVSLYSDVDLCTMIRYKMATTALSISIIFQTRDEVMTEKLRIIYTFISYPEERNAGECIF